MLKIKNHYKLCQKPVGGKGWKVDFCSEESEHYTIKLEHDILSCVRVYLQRKPTKVKDGENIYFFKDKDGKLTRVGISAGWIKDMGNLLTTLDNFTY